jgi:hypothetical protein
MQAYLTIDERLMQRALAVSGLKTEIEALAGKRKELAVFDPGPAGLRHGGDLVCPISNGAKRRGTSSSSRMRIGEQRGLRLFQYRDGQFPADRWEILQEDLQRVAGLQVIEKDLNRHARPRKNGGAAVKLWINDNQLRVHVES